MKKSFILVSSIVLVSLFLGSCNTQSDEEILNSLEQEQLEMIDKQKSETDASEKDEGDDLRI